MASSPLALTRRRVASGAVAGAVAWGFGLAVSSFGASAVFGTETLSSSGFFFYNAHFVPLSNVGGLTAASGNAVLEMMGPYGYAVAVLPALVLLLGGAVLAWRHSANSVSDASVAGATITTGYFVCSLLGAVAITGPFFGGTYRPNILLAAVLSGIVFPVLFGALGGILGLGAGRLGGRVRRAVA